MLQVNSSPQQQLSFIGKSHSNNNSYNMRMLTHDLASPLTAIKLNLDMLAPKVKQRREMMQKIYDGLDYIEKMLATEGLSKEKEYPRWFMSEVINEVVRLNSTRLKSNKIKVVKKYFCDRSYTSVPATAFYRVVNNLLNNAIDALVCVNEDGKCIWLAVKPVNNGIMFVVRDNGNGISNALCKKLLTQQVSTKATEGHGLGLLASLKLVKHYFKGSISFRKNDLAESGVVFEVFMQ